MGTLALDPRALIHQRDYSLVGTRQPPVATLWRLDRSSSRTRERHALEHSTSNASAITRGV